MYLLFIYSVFLVSAEVWSRWVVELWFLFLAATCNVRVATRPEGQAPFHLGFGPEGARQSQ